MVDFVFDMANELANKVGCRFVIVNSEKDTVERYRSYGFQEIPPNENDKTVLIFFDLGIQQNP